MTWDCQCLYNACVYRFQLSTRKVTGPKESTTMPPPGL